MKTSIPLIAALLGLSAAAAVAAECEFKNLGSLGWREGHKNDFCIGKKYHGVTNIDAGGNNYHKNRGGWCWKGDSYATCHAELNQKQPCIEYQAQTGVCLALIYQ